MNGQPLFICPKSPHKAAFNCSVTTATNRAVHTWTCPSKLDFLDLMIVAAVAIQSTIKCNAISNQKIRHQVFWLFLSWRFISSYLANDCNALA